MAKEARLESLRRIARRRLGLDKPDSSSNGNTSALPTVSASMRLKASQDEKERNEKRLLPCPLYGYNDEEIWKDERLAIETVLREKGLISNAYAVSKILETAKPATAPRPEMTSQIQFCKTDA